jgi:hypothetical protein
MVRANSGPATARITLTVQPSAETSIDAIRNWPNATAALFGADGKIEIAVSPYPGSSPAEHATPINAVCEWSAPSAKVAQKINDFWQRLMVSRWSGSAVMKPDWADFIEVLKCAREDRAELPDIILATPHAEASLAFTLERGRTILDALQGEERPAPDARFIAPASFDEASYDEAARDATASSDGGLLWPSPQMIADMALSGRGGLDRLIRRIHRAHHRATPEPERRLVCRDDKQMLDIARARYGALLTHPVLQRLVGFAVDITVPADQIADIASASGGYIQLSLAQENRIWTLAKYEAARGGWFGPASRKEADAELAARAKGHSLDLHDLPERLGLINLATKGANGPRYDLCTVDPALASENDLRRRQEAESVEKKQQEESAAAQKHTNNFDLPPPKLEQANTAARTGSAGTSDLRTGGLRLLDRNRLLAVCQQLGRAAEEQRAARLCLSGQATVLQDAYDLETGFRLLIGLRPASGDVEWRCPQFRQVEYRDPADHKNRWVERELKRRLGPASATRRIELDAGTLNVLDQIVQTESNGAPKDDIETKIANVVTESTVAAWGGESMGLPPMQASRSASNREARVSFASIDGLNVIRSYAPPSKTRGNERQALNPRLRFGWPYHVALARVVQGGVALTREEAGVRLSATASYALPPTSVGNTAIDGRRFTRHERVDAPMVLFLEEHLRELKGIKPTQHGTWLIVRSSHLAASARPKCTHRILAPPPVPMHFASLHGVFDHLTENVKRPPEGLQGFTRPDVKRTGNDPSKPQHIRPSARRAEAADPELRYYPDPAASYLALALKRPETGDDEPWLHDPLILHVAPGTWPSSTPVRLECIAADEAEENSLQLRDLGQISYAGATLRSVQCLLRPGEDIELHAWYIPTIGQLANWFDAVQAAALLATHEGQPLNGFDAQSACVRGLKALVGAAAGAPPPGLANSEVCTGAGSLPLPPRATVRMLAALVHQSMLKRPVTALAAALPMRLTHATDHAPAPSFLPATVAAARRKFPGGDAGGEPGKESRLDFITASSTKEWDARCSQEGAVEALLGGRLKLDPIGTGAFEIEIECAGPNTDTLDDPKRGRGLKKIAEDAWPVGLQEGNTSLFGFAVGRDHKVTLTKTLSKALRVDGLPYPRDCKAALREDWTLEQLQASAWGRGKPLGDALRCTLFNVLTSSGARHVKIRPVAIPRHSGLMPKATEKSSAESGTKGPFAEFWLPSTALPSPPVIDRIQSGFHDLPAVRVGNLAADGTFTLRAERRSSHRIWLRRPWFSSGEDERLGIVLWPPGLFVKGALQDDIKSEIPILEVLDGDLGVGGQFVSRWGADPIMKGHTPTGPLLLPKTFEGDCEDVQTAFMPIPAQVPWSSQEPGQGGTEKQRPRQYFAVALKTFVPKFDPAEELWYVDVALDSGSNPMPRVRLGLVRYQPHAREDVQSADGTPPVRLRVSTPVAEWIQPLPRRSTEVTCRTSSHGKVKLTTVTVTVSGAFPQPDQESDGSAILVDPAVPTNRTRPALEIELLRHREAFGTEPAQEELVLGTDRKPCVWRTWMADGPGRAARRGTDWAWIYSFQIEGDLSSHEEWRNAIAVREIMLGKRANEENPSIGGCRTLGTGPRYFARVELT